MSFCCVCSTIMNSTIPSASLFYLANQNFHAKRRSNAILTLIRHIDSSCLWCAVKAVTKNIFEKPELREKSIWTLINKTDYIHWRMGNSFIKNLTLKHLLAVNFLSKCTVFWRIWRRCLFQAFFSGKFERPQI